jgi:uncharacterized protein
VEPLHFGNAPQARFGVYHAAPGSTSSLDRGVVLCYPLGHEYLRAHRAFRNLALALNRTGLPVLRFDYLGSGDSDGDGLDAGVAAWQRDIDAAVDELKQRARVSRVSLVGLRFGATLAALAAARRLDIDTLVLWDPVLSGRAYLEELAGVQNAWLRDRLGVGADQLLDGQPELIGMPLPDALVRELKTVDLRASWLPRVDRLFVVMSSPSDDYVQWLGELKAGGLPAGLCYVPGAGDWLNPEAVHQLLLPHEILKQITALASSP